MRFNIVKQSDVSFGTALHYALAWTYGRKALCGKPMRATAHDSEVGYKRRCGSCVKIMARIVEAAHAEAVILDERRTIARAYLNTPSGVVLTDDEIEAAIQARAEGNEAALNAASQSISFRLLDTRTGTVRRILGTSPAANAPHMTTVWVQREGERGVQGWSADMLMSTWHDLVAIDENGQRNVAWQPHHIKGVKVEGVNSSDRAEVLGTVAHDFAGVGVMVRYEDYDQPVFLSERVLRGCPDYVAV